MKKWFILLIPILIINYTLINYKSNENNFILKTENNAGNESITHNEICKTVTDIDTDEHVMSINDSNITAVSETALTITTSETGIVSSAILKDTEPLQEDNTIMSTEDRQLNRTPIVIMSIYESWAYGFEQNINVLDSEGYYYYYQTYDEMEKIDIKENNWYDKILEIDPIKKDEYYIQVNEESMKVAINFSGHLADYKDCDMKEYYDIEEYDTGILSVYGIYYDKDGIPQYINLCSYGEQTKCIDNKDVIDFVNQMSFTNDMRYIFYDGFKVRFYS